MRRIRSFLTDPELWCATVFGLLVTTHVFLMLGFMQHRPDAPDPLAWPPQHATPQATASAPPRSF